MEIAINLTKFVSPYFSAICGGLIGKKTVEILSAKNIPFRPDKLGDLGSDLLSAAAVTAITGTFIYTQCYFIYDFSFDNNDSRRPGKKQNFLFYVVIPASVSAIGCFVTNLLCKN